MIFKGEDNLIREMTAQDEKRYLDMGQEFYSSNAVLQNCIREKLL